MEIAGRNIDENNISYRLEGYLKSWLHWNAIINTEMI